MSQTSKAKGRRFQQLVRDMLLKKFPSLEADDVRSTSMGAGGEDIQLSPAARKLFPYSIECKARKALPIQDWYDQAKSNSDKYEPIVFIKKDRCKPLVVLDAEYFIENFNGV